MTVSLWWPDTYCPEGPNGGGT